MSNVRISLSICVLAFTCGGLLQASPDLDKRPSWKRNPGLESSVELQSVLPRATSVPWSERTELQLFAVTHHVSRKGNAIGGGVSLGFRLNPRQPHEGRIRMDYAVFRDQSQPRAVRTQDLGVALDWMPRLARWSNGGLRFILGGGAMNRVQEVEGSHLERDSAVSMATGIHAQFSRRTAVEIRYVHTGSFQGNGSHAPEDSLLENQSQLSVGLGFRLK